MLTAVLCSCNPKGAENSKNATPGNGSVPNASNDIAAEVSPAEIIGFCDTIPIDSYVPNSPSLKISVALEPLTLDNSAATARAINSISYAMTGTESDNMSDAIGIYRNKLISEYEELRSDYINIRANNEEPFWLNHEHAINGRCEIGYKGYVNYIMDFYDYTGGAHPNSYKSVLAFGPSDGQEITIDNIFKEDYEEVLLALITQALMDKFNVTVPEGLDQYLFNHNELFVSKNVILGKEKITFIYNKYEIAPYSTGEILLDITYDKIKELLK